MGQCSSSQIMAGDYITKGSMLEERGQYQEAINCYNEALKLEPQNTAAYITKGNALHSLKKDQEAIKCYNMALRLEPKNAAANINKGNVLQEHGQYQEAINCYTKALREVWNESLFYCRRGEAYNRIGKKDFAKKDFNSANDYWHMSKYKSDVIETLQHEQGLLKQFHGASSNWQFSEVIFRPPLPKKYENNEVRECKEAAVNPVNAALVPGEQILAPGGLVISMGHAEAAFMGAAFEVDSGGEVLN